NLLDLQDDQELQNWLNEKRVKLTSFGYGESAELLVVVGGKEVLIGDNKKPTGRTINRRVMLQLETK
ncbi:MAG: hypothetical protein ACPL6C_01635, partial [bacterium]